MRCLVTGGLGYIGSHTVVQLIEAGHSVVILDNLSNSSVKVLRRIESITGVCPELIQGDIRCSDSVLAAADSCESVFHFAGVKSVGDSVIDPLTYYSINVMGTINLLTVLKEFGIKLFVFSSSATVYGNPCYLPIDEKHPLTPLNPYGRSKLQVEDILKDLQCSDPTWKIAILRYFNPCGAHPSGLLGEDPTGKASNLFPCISRVMNQDLDALAVFGSDYNTKDGTGVRDYIHVVDLANGHLAALKALENTNLVCANLGTGVGYSVLEIVNAFEAVSGVSIPLNFSARREGDTASCFANPEHANKLMGWKAGFSLAEMCNHHCNWLGFESAQSIHVEDQS